MLARGAVYSVCGFFVISGASMAIAYRTYPPFSWSAIAAFYTKRFFRIAPLYYLVLTAFTAGRAVGCLTGEACNVEPAKILSNLTFVFGFGKAALNSEVVAGWSIGIEWIFYFSFPLLFWFATRSMRNVVLLMVLGAVALGAWDMWYLSQDNLNWPTYAQFPAYFWYFTVGLGIGLVRAAKNQIDVTLLAWVACLACLAIYLILDLSLQRPYKNWLEVAGPSAWPFAVLVSLLVMFTTFSRVSSNNLGHLFKISGDLSYGVYLLHFPVSLAAKKLGATGATGATLSAAAAIALAAMVYQYFERPLIKFGSSICEPYHHQKPFNAKV